MLVSAALLFACCWVLGRVLRGALVGVQAGWVARGRPPLPMAFTLRPVPVPAGETLLFAAAASRWGLPAPAPGGGGRERTIAIGRRRVLRLGLRITGPRYTVAGRARDARGLVVVTDRRVLFRGTGRGGPVRDDVPLGDVAHLRVDGPLLAVERRSAGARPLVLRAPSPVLVARLVAAAAAAAAGRFTR